MRQFRIIGVALLLWLPSCLWAEAPENVYGVWSGMLTEVIVAGQQYSRYKVTITLAPNRHRIDYDSLGCGGKLRLILNNGRFFRFQDEMDYGLDACSSGGRTELHVIGPERAAYQWFDAEGVLKAEGYLKRRQQRMI